MDFEALSAQVAEFLAVDKHHAALNVALSGVNACHREGDRDGVVRCLALMRSVVDQVERSVLVDHPTR